MPKDRGEAKERVEIASEKRAKTPLEKRGEHLDRIQRTFIASMIGIVAGIVSFLLSDVVTGFLVMVVGIVLQKYLFYPLRHGLPPLGAKDWFYQSFMTFSIWFIVLTFLLTSSA
ncbi:MAG: hypothetical protein QHG99_08655 [Methanomicrobiales archaeon]|nr:hypothetical protein [Methanomicrobiales archaeon]